MCIDFSDLVLVVLRGELHDGVNHVIHVHRRINRVQHSKGFTEGQHERGVGGLAQQCLETGHAGYGLFRMSSICPLRRPHPDSCLRVRVGGARVRRSTHERTACAVRKCDSVCPINCIRSCKSAELESRRTAKSIQSSNRIILTSNVGEINSSASPSKKTRKASVSMAYGRLL